MQIEYRRDLNHNYVILESTDEIDTNCYQVRMILSNDIRGFLPCSIRGVDGKTLFYYEITSRQSLKNLYEQKSVDYSLLMHLYEQIFQGLDYLKQFLLDINDLVLLPELIFLDPETENVSLCFLPGYEKDIRQSLRVLIEYLLPKINHQNQEAVMAGYGLYRKIMDHHINIESLKDTLLASGNHNSHPTSIDSEKKMADPEKTEAGDSALPDPLERRKILDEFFSESEAEQDIPWNRYLGIGITVILTASLILCNWFHPPLWLFVILAGCIITAYVCFFFVTCFKNHRKSLLQSVPSPFSMPDSSKTIPDSKFDFSFSDQFSGKLIQPVKKEISNPCGETTRLHMSDTPPKSTSILTPIAPLQIAPIPLEKDMVLIGKFSQAVDVVLDAPTVSRIHAKIQKSGDYYYLSDLNSKNGTYINNSSVTMGEECLLHDGDEVKFADLTFRFHQ